MQNKELPRFISLSTCGRYYKIHVHLPDDTVTPVRTKVSDGLKNALERRNEIGNKAWQQHWKNVVANERFFLVLPHTARPKLIYRNGGTVPCYRVVNREAGKTRYFNLAKYGVDEAYNEARKWLQEEIKEHIDILLYMGRIEPKDLLPDAPDEDFRSLKANGFPVLAYEAKLKREKR